MPKDEKQAVAVYGYLNYRSFLHDKFQDQKRLNPGYSYRVFARQAGIRSSGFLKMLIDGKRNLTEKSLAQIAKGFRLTKKETKYLDLLVRFNNATDAEAKDRYFQELLQNKKFLVAKKLAAAQYGLFTHWYYVAIVELVRLKTGELKDDVWIFNHLNPRVGLVEVRKAVADLIDLGLLERTKRGSLKRRDAMLATDDEVNFLAATKFHVIMSRLAMRAVAKEKGADREFTTLTIALSERDFDRVKERIREFRNTLHSMLEQTEEPRSAVAQMNFQLFKLSRGS